MFKDDDLQASLAAQTVTIDTKLEAQKVVIETKMDEGITVMKTTATELQDSVEETLTSFETRSDTAITQLQAGADKATEAGEELETTAKKYSWKASIAPNPSISGDSITLQLQGQPGKFPLLNIYTHDGGTALTTVMPEVGDGLYQYTFVADNRFIAGKAYTYLISEEDTGGLVSGSGVVEAMSLTTIAGLAAAGADAKRVGEESLKMMEALQTSIGANDGTRPQSPGRYASRTPGPRRH